MIASPMAPAMVTGVGTVRRLLAEPPLVRVHGRSDRALSQSVSPLLSIEECASLVRCMEGAVKRSAFDGLQSLRASELLSMGSATS